ncbi:DNA-binding protein [Labedaea rhizosphaerae]|uniref:Excisionase family DNA binding protein n=1 Tax=Labedaea rhizosphaerae TaxID=598644 RepID=A0A4V3CXJ4_LABRH|nr:DNA-binding protein [Labedaea rhizosphaerae]TDP90508.1 hypothetical protein EV186_11048 [Labedaea rhizosphaerae]
MGRPITDVQPIDVLSAAGPTVSMEVAAKALSISRGLAYELAKSGQLTDGIRVLKLGTRVVVPTADLRRVLGLAA